MPFKNRFLFAGLLILTAALIAIWFAPLVVSNGIRLWVWWKARQEGLVVNLDQIDAPLLRPVVIRSCRLRSGPDDAFEFEFTAKHASLDLNLKRILLGMGGRAVRNLSIQELRGEVRRSNPVGRTMTQRGWATLHNLLPGNLSVATLDFRAEVGPTMILLRKGFLSASEIEAGRFSAAELMIASPWFRQTFSDLRGATNWQANRLAVAGLPLTHGLDLQSITADLSRLSDQHVGVEFDVDAFGGKIRANISQDWRSHPANWKVAGSASDISLAQTSEAIGFTDRIDGSLHACNFTFNGNLAEPSQVIASLWTELTALTWRNRTAEAITLGAAFYNRQIQLQQLYIRQKTNQLTLSGEGSFPSNPSDWFSPDFRGAISASINQLGDFAALFGANPGDFAGNIAIDGTMNTRNRKLGGHLTFDGVSLTLFKTAIDTLSAKLNLKATELEIEQLALKRKNDSLTAQGKIDMSHEHNYSGTIEATVDDLAEYLSIFCGPAKENSKPAPTHIQVTVDANKWNARGVIGLPNSSPVDFTANFPLPIGTSWTAFRASPVEVTLNFPSIFLANAPQFFHPEIFRDGILSGNIFLSGTLQHPRINGEVGLLSGILDSGGRTPFNLSGVTSHITFSGDRGSLEFFNAAAGDVDLSLSGTLDFQDSNDLVIKIAGATPIFDLTMQPIDCVGKIEVGAVTMALAPAVAEIEFRGGLFQSGWTISLKDRVSAQFVGVLDLNEAARKFPLCFSSPTAAEKTLLLGAPPRPEAQRETIRPKKRTKRQ
jgi:hypothetical protein